MAAPPDAFSTGQDSRGDVRAYGASDEIDRLLERVRRAFDVRSAALLLFSGVEARLAAVAGGPCETLLGSDTAFRRHAEAEGRLFVVTNTAIDPRFSAERGASGVRFFGGAPVPPEPARPSGVLCLLDVRPRRLTAGQKRRLCELSEDIGFALDRGGSRPGPALALVGRRIESAAPDPELFERASAAAGLGVWECRLRDEALRWSDGVYDLFELPRGSRLHRPQTLEHYAPQSLELMQRARARAIAEGSGFTLDSEIVTARGRRRWIRLTATVERRNGVPARIFGVKQDVTEQRAQAERTRRLAETDPLTGLANRGLFQARLAAADDGAALILIDLDGFKQINDTFGHALGDACIAEAAARIGGASRGAELVARIGGDEFAVLPDQGLDRHAVEALGARIVAALAAPVDGGGLNFAMSASVGIAHAGAAGPSELFARADAALYAAKAAGRNTFRVFGPAMAATRMARAPTFLIGAPAALVAG